MKSFTSARTDIALNYEQKEVDPVATAEKTKRVSVACLYLAFEFILMLLDRLSVPCFFSSAECYCVLVKWRTSSSQLLDAAR